MASERAWLFLAGATGRVGSAAAETLASQGENLVLHSSGRTESLTELAGRLTAQYGVHTVPVTADVTDAEQLARLNSTLAERGIGALAALVNCTTAYTGGVAGIAELTGDEFRRVVDADLVGAFLLVRELLPLLINQKGAKVVLFSSVAGLRGRPGAAHLCAAKAGVHGLTLALAKELAAHGIAVNCVAPGPIVHADQGRPTRLPPGVAVSTPQEVVNAATYLASAASSPISGQVLVVNGGEV
ncbi:SDR family oxidoreductase [Planosporangium thailandense]|uniref:SDR family oxidoreductase n=1 Tax=Planosporangium thailandense TaxID=765197 RepID=A0ABX0XXH0_9ACTN|nr:SDR family oxidoreductase [Planosporangium thailandense]NJC69935.1 SDR family oxidoreductase [Planosporangium thailandense]